MDQQDKSDLKGRLDAITAVEGKIQDLLRHSQTCIMELSKEKQISKVKMEDACSHFKKTLAAVDSELTQQMQYLSHVCVGSAHQGSTFSSQQNIALAEQTERALHEQLRSLTEEHFPKEPATGN